MRRIADLLAGRRWPLFLLPIILSGVLLRGPAEASTASVIATVIFGLALLATVGVLAMNLAGRDPGADQRAAALDPDPMATALLARWLSRSKHFRFVGGAAGFVLGFGIVNDNILILALTTFAGIAAGGALAEVHSLTRRTAKAASADIIVRDPRNYVDRSDSIAMAATAVTAVAIAAFAAVSDLSASGSALLASITALAVIAATLLMQRFVIIRPRPALPADLRRADDLMRRLAATLGFTKPAIALALGLLAQSLTWLSSDGVAVLGALLLWGAAIGWYVSSRQSSKNLLEVSR